MTSLIPIHSSGAAGLSSTAKSIQLMYSFITILALLSINCSPLNLKENYLPYIRIFHSDSHTKHSDSKL